MCTVFHTASLVDISPNPSPAIDRVNVDGTRHVIDACTASASVARLIYTSSIDACYDGRPVRAGDESHPYAPAPHLTAYIRTKGAAERLVLAADSGRGCGGVGALATCALRPGHIYGPDDPMIDVVCGLVRAGGVPVRFGDGVNDYLFVDNCAAAHVQCLQAMCADPAACRGKA